MRPLIIIACLIPSITTAETTDELIARLRGQPSPILPMPLPAPIAPNGFAVYERERPLPPQWGVDSYRSYKFIPLDRYGQPTQPLITMDEVMTDMLYGALQKNQPKD